MIGAGLIQYGFSEYWELFEAVKVNGLDWLKANREQFIAMVKNLVGGGASGFRVTH